MPTLTLQPSSGIDTFIDDLNPTVNQGSATTMPVGRRLASGSQHTAKGLIQFDLSSFDNANWYLTSATLRLNCTSETNTTDRAVEVHRSLVQWFEAGSTWNLRNTTGSIAWVGGAGGASGSDYAASASATATITGTGNFDWDVLADVRNWLDGINTNNGWWLIGPAIDDSAKTFLTSDAGGNRPSLILEYEFRNDLTLSPVADTYISEVNPTFNYGAATEVKAGNDASNLGVRGMVKFNFVDIPSDATIISAKLRVYCSSELSSTDRLLSIYRFLVQWYEGNSNGAAPGGSVDATTWNYRNANGSIAWTSGAGGGSAGNGVESASSLTGSVNITSSGSYFEIDVKSDVQNFVNGTYTNFGWWLRGIGVTNATKTFSSRESLSNLPELVIEFSSNTILIQSSIAGSTSISASLEAKGNLAVALSGSTAIFAQLLTNEFIKTDISGSTSVSGDITGVVYLETTILGSTSLVGHLQSQIFISPALIESATSVTAHVMGIYHMVSLLEGSSSLVADPSFQGQVRSSLSGSSFLSATGYAKALHVATVIGCNPVPLLYITDGSIKPNGQLNLVNLLSERNGYRLKNWKPVISQYKDGGRFSSSPLSQGRRLRSRSFDNVIEVFDLSAVDYTQDALIQYQQDLIAFQEAAADYWVSDFVVFPIYLVARAARETNTRYAIIHLMSIPELENPYQQPFFDSKQAAMETMTLRVERGHWTSTPPGKTECVAISSQRSWTVSGWQSGS